VQQKDRDKQGQRGLQDLLNVEGDDATNDQHDDEHAQQGADHVNPLPHALGFFQAIEQRVREDAEGQWQ